MNESSVQGFVDNDLRAGQLALFSHDFDRAWNDDARNVRRGIRAANII
jgi:hypothetical protein